MTEVVSDSQAAVDSQAAADSPAVAGSLAAALVFLMIRSMPLWFAVMPGG